jgi:dTDP-glucose 4,6-dehydratase/UDP-glucuronate decarboxylase
MDSARAVVDADLEHILAKAGGAFETMGGRRLLIVGGAGFLGYYLVQAALAWNRRSPGKAIETTVFDNYSRGIPAWLSALEGTSGLRLVYHDITRPLPEGMPDFDYVVHAGSIASPIYYRRHPIETMDANVGGLRSLLEYARAQAGRGKPLSGFLFYSSSEIYGDPQPDHIPTPETYRGNVSCTGPRACYDESKRYGETLCVNFHRQHGIPVVVARPFNHYGPGLKITDGRLIPDFCRDILAGRDIAMLSDGSPRRTFCYAADAIAGYYRMLALGRRGEAYNIGIEAPEISVAALAEKLVGLSRDLLGYRGKVARAESGDGDYLKDNPERRCPVIAKAREHFGYDPSIGLDEGLRRTLIWYRENREGTEA